jgi:hypothetical protein
MAVTAVASSTTSASALAAGNDRKAVLLCNSDASDAYALFADGTASASNLSIVIPAKENAMVPHEFVNCPIQVVWPADGSGYLHVTTR